MSMFNELVIKNTSVKKIGPFLSLWKSFIRLTAKSYYEKIEPFTIKLYRNNKLNFLVNFNLILATLKRSKRKPKLSKGCSTRFSFNLVVTILNSAKELN